MTNNSRLKSRIHGVYFAIVLLYSCSAFGTKAEGPFSITAKIEGGHAEISVRASVVAKNLELQLYGSDGLEVKGAVPMGPLNVKTLYRSSLSPGDTWIEQADIIQSEGLTYLNASVTSNGEPSVVRSFAFGRLSEKQKIERQRGVRLDPEGNPIRLMGE